MRLLPVIFFLGVSVNAIAQNKPSNDAPLTLTLPTNSSLPSYNSSLKVNYVRTWTAKIPLQNPTVTDLSDNAKYQQSTTYLDGLGNPLQEVVKAASPDGLKDLVSMHIYDAYGREVQKYLPYPATPASGNEGKFKVNPFAEQQTYYNTNYNDQRPYGQTDIEASPLSRPVTSFAPGNSWMGSKNFATPVVTTNEHAARNNYEVNEANEVVLWNIGNNSGDLPYKGTSTYYSAGQLYRSITQDEDKKRVVEYKDKEGHIILKKVELPVTTGVPADINSHNGWLCTYYVYDDYGLLRFVMQPEAVKWLAQPANNWMFPVTAGGGDIGNELCFQYEYDERNRMSVKKVPGAGEVWMVYDKRDRLIMSQDANQRSQRRWLVTQYDELNRPVRTYIMSNTRDRIYHQNAATGSHSVLNYPSITGKSTLLTETYYDNYDWVGGSGSGLSSQIDGSQVNGDFLTVPNTTYPYPQPVTADVNITGKVTGTKVNILGTGIYIYTVSFYDGYGRLIQLQSTNQMGGKETTTSQYSFDGKPLIIRRMHQVNTSANTLFVVNKINYDHAGRLLKTTHQITDGNNQFPEATISENEYDDLGKLKTKRLGRELNAGGYNAAYHPGYAGTSLEKLDYTYNVRGWLTGINRGYANPDKYVGESFTQNNRWFGMELAYDQGFSHNEFNGNISGTVWRSRGDDKVRAYGFRYDEANRLLKADFTQNQGLNSWGVSDGINFSMRMGNGLSGSSAYDDNGNIKGMQQYGYKIGNGSVVIDDMQYTYFANTNKLQAVTEQNNGTTVYKLGDFTDGNTSGDDYGYDVNGNMVTDKNKQIESELTTAGTTGIDVSSLNGAIVYNYLNLPEAVTVKNKGHIEYTYDAIGNKLTKVVTERINGTDKHTITHYIGGFVYEQINNDPVRLQYFGHDEGRVRPVDKPVVTEFSLCTQGYWIQDDDGNWIYINGTCNRWLNFESYQMYAYDYMIKDHLGNVRAVLTDEQHQTNYPAATLEKYGTTNHPSLQLEKQFYTIEDNNIVNAQQYGLSNAYENNNGFINPNPNGDTYANSENLYRLNGSIPGAKKGLDIVMKVMSGDHIDIFGKSYHTSADNDPVPFTQSFITSLLNGLLGASGGVASAGSHGANSATLGGISSISDPLQALQIAQYNNTFSTRRPQAGICWILFDERFNVIDKHFSPVAGPNGFYNHYQDAQMQNIPVDRNGYLYVFCSNESEVNVLFDNLQVVHTKGPLLEETHYYPFGLTMAGISSKAANKLNNKKLYAVNELQDKEFSDGSGLEFYDFNARTYSQQIGRFLQIDPLSDKEGQESWDPYHYCYNNPILNTDPDGKSPYVIYRGLRLAYELIKWSSRNSKPISIPAPRRMVADETRTTISLPIPVKPPQAVSVPSASQQTASETGVAAITQAPGTGLTAVKAIVNNISVIAEALNPQKDNSVKVYQVEAGQAGLYPVLTKGFSNATSTTPLDVGDIWKYGTTTKLLVDGPNTKVARYGPNDLPPGSRTTVLAETGPIAGFFMEKALILNYWLNNGVLPPGNKILK